MSKAVIIGVLLLSLSAIPMLCFMNNTNILKKELHQVGGLLSCFFIVVVASIALFSRYFRNVEPLMYAYCLFCWTAMCSLLYALQTDGFVKNMYPSFLIKGESYMKTAYGTLYSYWDGTVHLALCLAIILQYTRRESHRELSLFLCGSMVNSLCVFFYGALCGPHSVTWFSLFRLAHIIIPVNAAVYYLHIKPIQARSFIQIFLSLVFDDVAMAPSLSNTTKVSLCDLFCETNYKILHDSLISLSIADFGFPSVWKRPVDSAFMLFFKFACAFALFKGLAVQGANLPIMKDFLKSVEPYLKDPSLFPKFQVITHDFLFGSYYVFAIYALMFPGQHWMSDWSLIHAGAAAQAQFCYIGGAFHHLSSKSMQPPLSGAPAILFWTTNILLFVVPILFAYRCHRDPEMYGRSYTATLSTPIERRYVRTTKSVTIKSD